MRVPFFPSVLLGILLVLTGGGALADVTRVATGLDRPVFATAPPGDGARLFVVLQRGEIVILDLTTHEILATPFLDVTGLATGNEQGLLGLAFHPNYFGLEGGAEGNGLFYVNYTQANRDTLIVEYQVSANPDIADPTGDTILQFAQPQANHNGGWIGFGPNDGYLYIASGDGGAGNDVGTGHTLETGNAQDLTDNLLGKILRIDVDVDDFPSDDARDYGIPETNPFTAPEDTGDDEIWHYGLRNPYRSSFDRQTGNLYIGDVGQGNREEVDVQPDGVGGLNFGWRLREGTILTPTGGVGGPPPVGAVEPVFDYAHSSPTDPFVGCSVTGGVVYRGPDPTLDGIYFFGDFCTGNLWSLRFDGSDPSAFDGTNFSDLTDHSGDPDFMADLGTIQAISGFGEDDAGNVYLLKLGTPSGSSALSNTGEIFLLPEPSPLSSALSAFGVLAWLRKRPRWSRGEKGAGSAASARRQRRASTGASLVSSR